jgi:hypothetical protein
MNRSLLSRIAPFLLAFYALSIAAFFAYAIITFSATTLLPAFRWEYALKKAFVLFIRYLIPIHAAAVAVASSLAALREIPVGAGAPARPFNKVVSSTIVAFLLLAAAYTALFEGVYPGVERRLADMQYRSSVARVYTKQANTAMAAKDYHAALDAVTRYLAIDGGNKDYIARRLELESLAAQQSAPPPVAPPAAISDGESAQELIEKARAAFAAEDWFTAHYFAQAAAALDPRRADAVRLAAQAWDKIGGLTQPEKDRQTADFYKKKKDAYALLVSGNAVGAYYQFVALAAEDPKDKDIATYLEEAGKAVAQTTFFIDDARRIEAVPGTQAILFLQSAPGDAREAVYIGKMVDVAGGEAYFYDIEAIHYNAAGSVAWHLSAPYGTRVGQAILMHSIDRKDPAVQSLPLYLRGSRPAAERNVLAVAPSMEEMRALSLNRNALQVMGITELWRMRADLGSLGLARNALSSALAMKIIMPFAFFILSILAVSLGWAFRTRALGKLPASGIILLPLVPAVLALLSLLYLYAHQVVTGFAILSFGFTTALIILGVLQVVLLSVALVLLAGQTSR